MKSVLILSLCVPLVLGPAVAIQTKPSARAEADMEEQCKACGGCFLVTEEGFKKAMVIAFEKGAEHGVQVGYQYGIRSCSKGTM